MDRFVVGRDEGESAALFDPHGGERATVGIELAREESLTPAPAAENHASEVRGQKLLRHHVHRHHAAVMRVWETNERK